MGLAGDSWARDLGADLDRLREHWKVDLLISLVEDHELVALGIPDLVVEAGKRGIEVVRSPIVDGRVPSMAQARGLCHLAVEAMHTRQRVVFHCRGGLGRAGTLAACVLRTAGIGASDAVHQVRRARKGAIENVTQELFVAGF
jgi:protein-tyrosine phosphatase